MHRYTQEEKDFIRDNCKGKSVDELQRMLNEHFQINVTKKSVKGIMYRNGWKNGMQGFNTRFEKSHTPHNKGKSFPHTSKTKFKKGNIPPSHKPVGSESIEAGYVVVKIAEPNVWVKKHRYIWEQAYGPIPDSMVIRFADGDKMNVTLDNLFLTPHRVCISVVKRGIEHSDPDLNVTTHKLAELELAIKDVKKHRKSKGE